MKCPRHRCVNEKEIPVEGDYQRDERHRIVLSDLYMDDTLFQHSQLTSGCMRKVDDPAALIGSPVSYLHDN